MDLRFTRAWHEVEALRAREPFDRTLARLDAEALVQALAGAASEDPVAANVIATELLNRLHRARAMGAAVALGIAAIVLLAIDLAITRTVGFIETAAGGVDLSFVAIALCVLSLVALVVARRAWRRLGPRA